VVTLSFLDHVDPPWLLVQVQETRKTHGILLHQEGVFLLSCCHLLSWLEINLKSGRSINQAWDAWWSHHLGQRSVINRRDYFTNGNIYIYIYRVYNLINTHFMSWKEARMYGFWWVTVLSSGLVGQAWSWNKSY
jgi:hypothetical protein